MKKPNFTAGPWFVGRTSARGDTQIMAKSKRGLEKSVAYLAGFFKSEREANAKLIAASPLLAEALASLLEIHSLAGESPLDAFERIGQCFYRDTGMLRPGKDDLSGKSPEDRERAFAVWWQNKEFRAVEALVAAGYEVEP